MNYLSLASCVKQESKYIYDYYLIHKFLGVENFTFYDRGKDCKELSDIFANHADVNIIPFPETPQNIHAEAWRLACQLHKNKSKWLILQDLDQVLFPFKTNDLKIMLQDYEQFGSVSFNWHTMGSSNIKDEPTDLSTYEAYTFRANDNAGINNHVQSAVDPSRVINKLFADPHHAPNLPHFPQVNSNKEIINSPFNYNHLYDVAACYHYYTRSEEYWKLKISKTRCDIYGASSGTMDDFYHHQTYMNEIEDTRVKDLWQKVKQSIK